MKRYRRYFLLLPGVIILLISLGLNYYLFNQSHEYYLALNATRLDPLGLSTFSEAPEIENPNSRSRVVFFGDSRAASWPAPALDEFDFENRGIGAQTSTQVLLRFDDHVVPLQPQVVILQVGINDLKTLPLFPDQSDPIVEACKANIQAIVTRSNALGATVILTTIFPVGNVPLERRLFWSDEIASAVTEVNRYIRSLAAENVIILDTYTLLADSDGVLRAELAVDTLHIHAEGYSILNQQLISVLTSLHADS